MRWLTLSCFSLLSTGCSFIFVRPPSSEPEKQTYFDCVSNAAAPATDIANTVFDGLLIASALDTHEQELAVGAAVTGAVYAASAIYGLIMTSKCSSAKERFAAHLLELERNRLMQKAELRVERDAPRAPAALPQPEPGGCRSDVDCKGPRICVDRACAYPPPALAPGVPLPAPAATPTETPAPAPPPATP